MNKKFLIKQLIGSALVLSLPISYGTNLLTASASTGTSEPITSYQEEQELSNSNFSNGTSSNYISTSLTGWTGQNNDSQTTAGIIDVGTTFNTNKSTYNLDYNPGSKSTDNKILMINSKTSNSDAYDPKRQGYKTSSTISLQANSYYTFSVKVKTDYSYQTDDNVFDLVGTLTSEATSLSGSITNADGLVFVPFTSGSVTYYVCTSDENVTTNYTINYYTFSAGTTAYESADTTSDSITLTEETIVLNQSGYIVDDYAMVTTDGKVYYVPIQSGTPTYTVKSYTISALATFHSGSTDGETSTVNEQFDVDYSESAIITESGKKYLKTSIVRYGQAVAAYFDLEDNIEKGYITENRSVTNYTIGENAKYYSRTSVTEKVATAHGAMYLEGLSSGTAKFEEITCDEWTTFYFFVATGSESESVQLSLWLGGLDRNDTSAGVIFFDDVKIYRYSENLFEQRYVSFKDLVSTRYVNGSEVNTKRTLFVDLRNEEKTLAIYDFEDESLDDFTISQTGGYAKVLSLSNTTLFENITGYSAVGTDLSLNNEHGLVLWSNKDNSYVEVKSPDIEIKTNTYYKISVKVKVSNIESGSAYLRLEENDKILSSNNPYGLDENASYTLASITSSTTLTSVSEDNFTNDYQTLTMYVKGGSLYDTSINIFLCLGSDSENAKGLAVFDNITISEISASDYGESDNLEFFSYNFSTGITNGTFDSASFDSEEIVYPLVPSDFDTSFGENALGGVINVFEQNYNSYLEKKQNGDSNYSWVSAVNPGAYNKYQNNTTKYSDNVYMMYNKEETYQYIETSSFTISADTLQEISFAYTTISLSDSTATLTIELLDENNNVIYTDNSLTSENDWQLYTIYVDGSMGAMELKLRINLGTTSNKIHGRAYIDNLASSVSNSSSEEIQVGKNIKLVDLSNFGLNLETNEFLSGDSYESSSPVYTMSDAGTGADGGIGNGDSLGIENNYFVLQTINSGSSYSISSNYNIDLTSGNYYVLEFKLYTQFAYENILLDDDYDLDSKEYGLIVNLSNFSNLNYIKASTEEEFSGQESFTTIRYYIYAEDDVSNTLNFTLKSADAYTTGIAYITDLVLYKTDDVISGDDGFTVGEDSYKSFKTTQNESGYNFDDNSTFVATALDSSDSETDTDDTDDNTQNASSSNSFNWILLPSLIMALAIVIAIVGALLRRSKLKKLRPVKKQKNEYSRNSIENKDAIRAKAKQMQDEEIQTTNKAIETLKANLQELEAKHKEEVLAERKSGANTKNIEKKFKTYASQRNKIQSQIATLSEHKTSLASAEHLMTLEKTILQEEENKLKQLRNVSQAEIEEARKNIEKK